MTSEPPREPERGNTPSTQTDPAQVSTERATYNVVSDTITGINIRKDDNKLQAIIILVSVLLFATITALVALISPSWNLPWYGGAVLGAFAGLVIGFFTSGLFLMIYRALRHMQGKHD